MKNKNKWRASRIVWDEKLNAFVPNFKVIYAGSYHIARIQIESYLPVFKEYCKGKLLDLGCGNAPYMELLQDYVTNHYCVDWNEKSEIHDLLDEHIDLNKTFELKEKDFDCVLLSDVIAHVKYPAVLIQTIANHLAHNGTLVLTTPFIYWMSEPPHEYFHPTSHALKQMMEDAQMEIVYLEPYGGRPDVLLDTMNKGMTGRLSFRIFWVLASVVKKTSWYKKTNEKTRYSYPIGYTMVARKKS
jgi:SAM-dependent methyltransferase